MPRYTITTRGGLLSRTGVAPQGSVVEMSAAEAASLPPGTVELVLEAPVLPPPPVPTSAPTTTEAPKTGRKGTKS